MYAHPLLSQLPDFWCGPWPLPEPAADACDPVDVAPENDPASLYREAYYAGMADGPAPGAD